MRSYKNPKNLNLRVSKKIASGPVVLPISTEMDHKEIPSLLVKELTDLLELEIRISRKVVKIDHSKVVLVLNAREIRLNALMKSWV